MKLNKIKYIFSVIIFNIITIIGFGQNYTDWPRQSEEHQVLATYGETSPTVYATRTPFHEAIDIWWDTSTTKQPRTIKLRSFLKDFKSNILSQYCVTNNNNPTS